MKHLQAVKMDFTSRRCLLRKKYQLILNLFLSFPKGRFFKTGFRGKVGQRDESQSPTLGCMPISVLEPYVI